MVLLQTGYDVSAQVKRVIKGEGISEAELDTMAKKAAINTHDRGNRRFHGWIFDIQGNTLQRMTQDIQRIVRRQGSTNLTVHEDCEECDGDGCKECGWVGEVVTIYHT